MSAAGSDALQAATPQAATPRLAAIVVTYRTGPRLWTCLDHLDRAESVDEIIVVDNGSPPDVEAHLRAWSEAPGRKLVSGQGNVGFGAGCNRGARAAGAAVLVFVNPDAEVEPEACARLAAVLERSCRPAIAGGRILGLDGREQRGARRGLYTPISVLAAFLGLERLPWIGRFAPRVHFETDPPPPGPAPVAAISGAFFAMRADDFALLEGFDEGYFLHVEDVDLCRRALQAGGGVIFVPDARARHEGATSDAPSLFVARCKGRSFARYFRKFARTPQERAWAAVLAPVAQAAAWLPALAARLSGKR